MADGTSYEDIGAHQRREAADGSPTDGTSYEDIGAHQREEAAASAGGKSTIVGGGIVE